MPALDEVIALAAAPGRGAGTDAERRAAARLRDELRARGRPARLETIWVRPQWAAVWAAHCLLAIAGSLLAARVAVAGLALLGATLLSLALELTGRPSLPSLLFGRRATQNLVSDPLTAAGRVRLVIVAPLDAPRTGTLLADPWSRLDGWLRRHVPGPLGSPAAWLWLLVLALAGFAAARVAGAGGVALGAAQLVPTVAVLILFGALVEVATSPPSPGGSQAAAVAVALDLVAALDADPPRHLDVELVLTGGSDGPQPGMAAYVRARRDRRPEEVAVLALGPCGGGTPRFFLTEGLLAPLRLHPRLIELAAWTAQVEPELGARAARRGLSAAWPARRRRWPAISVACLDELGRAPRHRTVDDTTGRLEGRARRAALELCLGLVARLDADLERSAG